MKTNAESVSDHLDEVERLMEKFKRPSLSKVARRVLTISRTKSEFWPEDIDHSDLPEADANCVGLAFRSLARLGLIKQTGNHRPSRAEGARGRRVFGYRGKEVPA